MLEYITGFFEDRQLLLSAVAAAIALISLFQTQRQTTLSNKHSLFDKRVDAYCFLKEILDIWEYSSPVLNNLDSKKIIINPEAYLVLLTSSLSFQHIAVTIKTPPDIPKYSNISYLIEQLSEKAEKFEFLFNKKDSVLCKKLASSYLSMLRALWTYEQVILETRELSKQFHRTFAELVEHTDEYQLRQVFFASFDLFKSIYSEFQNSNTLEKIKSQIKVY